jgi:hypothetical protein
MRRLLLARVSQNAMPILRSKYPRLFKVEYFFLAANAILFSFPENALDRPSSQVQSYRLADIGIALLGTSTSIRNSDRHAVFFLNAWKSVRMFPGELRAMKFLSRLKLTKIKLRRVI